MKKPSKRSGGLEGTCTSPVTCSRRQLCLAGSLPLLHCVVPLLVRSHRDVAPRRIVFRRCQRSRLAWISCLPPMNACNAQAKHPPAPTPTLRRLGLFVQHNIHGLDAHLATRRSGDQCTRGPLQTPSDGATHTVLSRRRFPLKVEVTLQSTEIVRNRRPLRGVHEEIRRVERRNERRARLAAEAPFGTFHVVD